MLLAGIVYSTPYTTGLVNYWDCESVADVKGSADFTIISGAFDTAPGIYGLGCDSGTGLDPTGNVLSAYSDDIPLKTGGFAFTLNLWIKYTSGLDEGAFIGARTGSAGATNCFVQYNEGAAGINEQIGGGSYHYGNVAPIANNFNMITMVYDGTGLTKYYQNGSLIGSPAESYDCTNNMTVFNVKEKLAVAGYHIDNIVIDEIATWNRNLSVTEVAELWNSGAGLFYTPPSIYSITSYLPNTRQKEIPNATDYVFRINTNPSNCTMYANFTGSTTAIQQWFNNATGLISYYSFDEDAQDNWGNNDGTASLVNFTENGRIQGAYLINVSNAWIDVPDVDFTCNESFSAWVYFWDDINNYDDIWDHYIADTGGVRIRTRSTGDPDLEWQLHGGGTSEGANTYNVAYNTWHQVGYVMRSCTTMDVYLNGNKIDTVTNAGGQNMTSPTTQIHRDSSTAHFGIDEVQLWNRSLSTDEITLIYNNSRHFTPILKDHNTSLTPNTTFSTEGYYNFSFTCDNNIFGNEVEYGIDYTKPYIYVNPNNFFQDTTVKIGTQSVGLLKGNITFSDNFDIYGFEFLMFNETQILQNITNTTLSGRNETWIKPFNLSTYSPGKYNITITAWDSHTANSIGDFKPVVSKDKLTYDNAITITADKAVRASTTKNKDRYNFAFDFVDSGKKTFYIESNSKLDYIETSTFKGHFVDWSNKKWIDFEDVADSSALVTKVNDKKYKIEFSDLPSKVQFNSIGGLNNFTEGYSLEITPAPTIEWLSEPDLISFINTSYQRVNVTGYDLNATTFYLWNSSLDLQGAFVRTTTLNSTVENYTFVNLTESIYYVNASHTDKHGNTVATSLLQLGKLYFDNCTKSSNVSFTFCCYDEDVPTRLLNFTADFEATFYSQGFSSLSNYKFSGSSCYNMCIYPATANTTIDVYIKYSTATGFTHRYFAYNLTVSNKTITQPIYNFNYTTGISTLNLVSRLKASYEYYPNVIGVLQRKYNDEGIWRNVQYDLSGDYGNIIFHVKEQSTDYRIAYFDKQNNQLKITNDLKFLCTDGLCDLTVLLSPYTGTAASANITTTTSYNNETGVFTLSWTDPTSRTSSVRLLVEKETMSNTISICDTTQTGAAGSMTCNLSSYTGTVAVRIYSSASPEAAIETIWLQLKRFTLGQLGLISEDEGAIWTTGTVMIVTGIGLFSPPAAVIAGVLGLIISFMFGFFSILTFPLLVLGIILGIVVGLVVRK